MAEIDRLRINGTNYDVADTHARNALNNLNANDIPFDYTGDIEIGSVYYEVSNKADVARLVSDERLLADVIANTRQVIVMTNGVVTGVNHIDISNHIIRADTFSTTTNTLVETRTLNTGESLTISTDMTTLISTITYTPASA